VTPRVHLDDYVGVVGEAAVEEIRALARPLEGRSALMVNSTAVGGGVAELLNRLIPLLEDLEIPTRWEVIRGGGEFFGVTKAMHNALHGTLVEITKPMLELFQEVNAENAAALDLDADLVVIHDPQPVALITPRSNGRGRWVWRCHVDISHPQSDVWTFLRQYVVQYDASVFSAPEFSQRLPITQYMIHPAIDPLAEKNREMEPGEVEEILTRLGIRDDRPIVTQVSRFDRLKDPVGVIRAYRLARRTVDCQLVLAGGGATDDPEGSIVLEEVRREADGDPLIHVLELPPFSDREINALQRASAVVVQKSLREGFGSPSPRPCGRSGRSSPRRWAGSRCRSCTISPDCWSTPSRERPTGSARCCVTRSSPGAWGKTGASTSRPGSSPPATCRPGWPWPSP